MANRIQKLDSVSARYCVRAQAPGGDVEKLGCLADQEGAITRARGYHDAHSNLKVWVWDVRTGRTVLQLEPLDQDPVSREVYRRICDSKSVGEVRRAFRSGGLR